MSVPESIANDSDKRVVDFDEVEVDESTVDWLVFIALHMDEAQDFTDDELLDDLLLMLGYRNDEERRTRSFETRYRSGFRRALERLERAHLVSALADEADEDLHYQLTDTTVHDIREVADAIGGTVWGDVGTDDIDAYSELGWLAIMALRMKDEARFLNVRFGGRSLASRDELLDKLNSLWRQGDQQRSRETLNKVLVKLEDEHYIEQKKALRGIREGWTLKDKAWGGIYSLHDKLQKDFEGQLLELDGDRQRLPPMSPDSSVSRATADSPAEPTDRRDGERNGITEQLDRTAVEPHTDTERQRSEAVPQAHIAKGASSSTAVEPRTGEIVSDIELCLATLLALPTDDERADHPPRERDIVESVARRLNIPQAYMEEGSSPPWTEGEKPEGGKWRGGWATMLHNRNRVAHLLAYRMEHVFRALSIEQVGLIRDVAIAEGGVGRWVLTERGVVLAQSVNLNEHDGLQSVGLGGAIHDYFRMHDYARWLDEQASWMGAVVEEFRKMAPAKDVRGPVFELLVRDLMAKVDEQTIVRPQLSNTYLDQAGVDIIVTSSQSDIFDRPHALLIQCKGNLSNDVQSDAASKLFATTVWLRALAKRNELGYRVTGARLVILADLSREATWTFWALRAAWEAMTEAGRNAHVDSDDAQTDGSQSRLEWEVWDSRKVLLLMKEHEVGVQVRQTSSGEIVSVDEDYLASLKEEVARMKAKAEKAQRR